MQYPYHVSLEITPKIFLFSEKPIRFTEINLTRTICANIKIMRAHTISDFTYTYE